MSCLDQQAAIGGMRNRCMFALLALIAGCALDIERYELGIYAPAYPLVHLYSRNPVACIPTAVGNSLGAPIGSIAATPFFALVRWTSLHDSKRAETVVESIALTPILAGGAITGTLFPPLSQFSKERRCGLH